MGHPVFMALSDFVSDVGDVYFPSGAVYAANYIFVRSVQTGPVYKPFFPCIGIRTAKPRCDASARRDTKNG